MKAQCGLDDCDCGQSVEKLESEVEAWKKSDGIIRGWLTRTIKQRDGARKAGGRLVALLEGFHPQARPRSWQRAIRAFKKLLPRGIEDAKR